MKHFRLIVLSLSLIFLGSLVITTQGQVTISGYIRDSISAENLYNATIYESGSLRGTVSNAYGFYSFTVPAGEINLRVSFVGYQQKYLKLTIERDTTINFKVQTKNDLDEVTVTALRGENEYSLAGHERIDMQTVKSLPAFAGEQDVLKSLTILPGVQQGHEGSAGLFVRGGSPDQNLILLDGVPVFNATHLFGFISVFTPEAIQSVDFYKSGFPARYGGRLSSVVDVRMKEGNKNKEETNLTLGLVSSKITHEGPIKKGKSSYLISARRTLLDLIITGAARINRLSSDESIVPGLNFYDLNAKFNFEINQRNRLYLSFYAGGDRLFSNFYEKYTYQEATSKQETKVNLKWGNRIGVLRWNSQIGNKLFLNTTLSSGMFQYNIHNNYKLIKKENNEREEQRSDVIYKTYVNNNKLQFLFDWYQHTNHKIQFGADAQANWVIPGKQKVIRNEGDPITRGNQTTANYVISVFADDKFSISETLTLYAGLRFEKHIMPKKQVGLLLPRISAKISPSPRFSFSLSYDEMAQPLHLLTNSSIGLPSDIWVPATKHVPPEFSRQFSLGTHINLNNNIYYKLDSYYKKMNGVINYKAGQSFMDIYEDWEKLVEIGDGEAWGFENSLNYSNQYIKAWLNYTLSWNQRQFANINNGNTFPFKFDRRNDINLGLVYKFSKQIECSAMWVFQTGQAATVPQRDYLAAGAIDYTMNDFITEKEIEDTDRIEYIEGYNKYRLPAFHHLDIGVTFKKQRKSTFHELKLGAYNVYARQNPYMYYPYTTRDGYRKYEQIHRCSRNPGKKHCCKFDRP